MSGSPWVISFPWFHAVPLVYLGRQISDLYTFHQFGGRKFGSLYLITLIGMDFGINGFWLTINWVLWFDSLESHRNLRGSERKIVMDLVSKSEALRRDGFSGSRISPEDLQRVFIRCIIVMDLVSKSEASRRDGFLGSRISYEDLQKVFIQCIIVSFLLHHYWRPLRINGISSRIDLIALLLGSGLFGIFSIWKLLVFKSRDSLALQSQILSSLIVSFLSASLRIYLLGLCVFLLQSFLAISFWFTMSQSSLLGKDSVEKTLGAVVSKMRIKIPKFDNSALIKGYAKTMIGRCMNPREQDMKGLLLMFPRICQVEGRVAGADLGLGRFQLDFDEEEDIAEVLKMEPFHFDGWMVSLVRWKPSVDPTYPSTLTFWVRVLGIPIEYWAEPTFESIGDGLGKVVKVDINGGRVQVIINGFKPLCFETIIEFDSGEETPVSLRYERLYGYCSYCFSLCHDVEHCEKKHGIRGQMGTDGAGAHNWSYKGAVVQDRLPKLGSEGKGKGLVTGQDREEGRIVPSKSQTNGFGKGNQAKPVQGEGSSRHKRFTNYAQFNDHRFHEQKKLKAKAKEASKVKVVESSEGQAAQAVAIKPKKIVRKSLVFEDEAGGSSVQHVEHNELDGLENQEVGAEEETPTDQQAIPNDLEMVEIPTAIPETELVLPHSEEGAVDTGDMELEVATDADVDNWLESADLSLLDQVVLDSETEVIAPVEEALMPIEEDDTLVPIADRGTEATKAIAKGKGKEVSVAKKKGGKGIVLPGVTTRKRMVQALISPRKRPAPKHGQSQGDDKFPPDQGPENGGPGGSQPPQPSA